MTIKNKTLILKKMFLCDYDDWSDKQKCHLGYSMLVISCISIITIPFILIFFHKACKNNEREEIIVENPLFKETKIENQENDEDENYEIIVEDLLFKETKINKYEILLLITSIMNSIIINTAIFSTIVFFSLKIMAKNKLIKNLDIKNITIISFTAFPILSILIPSILSIILCNIRNTKEKGYDNVLLDSIFFNPIGIIIGSTVCIYHNTKNIHNIKDPFNDSNNKVYYHYSEKSIDSNIINPKTQIINANNINIEPNHSI